MTSPRTRTGSSQAQVVWLLCTACFGHGCSGHRRLLEHEREYALDMDALVTVSSRNTNGIMLGTWMFWSPKALRIQTEFCFGHGCSGPCRLLEHERNYASGMDALVSVGSFGARTELLCFGHGCSGHCKLLEHERHYALDMDALVTVGSWNTDGILFWGMDALATVGSWNTNGIMLWAWVLWLP